MLLLNHWSYPYYSSCWQPRSALHDQAHISYISNHALSPTQPTYDVVASILSLFDAILTQWGNLILDEMSHLENHIDDRMISLKGMMSHLEDMLICICSNTSTILKICSYVLWHLPFVVILTRISCYNLLTIVMTNFHP